MPAERNLGATKKLSEGDKFARTLGLEDRPDIFRDCKEAFRRRADKYFDFDLPLLEQTDAMSEFVRDVTIGFPGYFDKSKHDNVEERLQGLQRYAISYLKKSKKLTTQSSGHSKKKIEQKTLAATATSPPPNENKNRIIKVSRPQPKPTYAGANSIRATLTSAAKAESVETGIAPSVVMVKKQHHLVQSHVVAPPVVELPAKSKSARPGPSPVQPAVPSSKTLSAINQENNEPDVDADELLATRDLPYAETSSPVALTKVITPEPPLGEIASFLASFKPSMAHRADAVYRAGIREIVHLAGLAHWEDSRLRKFMQDYKIATTPLEEAAIIFGISTLKGD